MPQPAARAALSALPDVQAVVAESEGLRLAVADLAARRFWYR